jgi:hypothetical protein
MALKLKVFLQRKSDVYEHMRGCCCCPSYLSVENGFLPPRYEEYIQGVGELLRTVRDRYGVRVEVTVVNPLSLFALWDSIRYRIAPNVPAWVLGRRKIFDGLPDVEELIGVLDEALEKEAA